MVVALRQMDPKLTPFTLHRTTDVSVANTALTVTPKLGNISKIILVTIKYSAAATVTATVTLKSGAGAGWDTLLQNISFTAATDGIWIPDAEIVIADDDVIDVLAPAGGAAITSNVAVYTGVLG